jgi:hypothetical protein
MIRNILLALTMIIAQVAGAASIVHAECPVLPTDKGALTLTADFPSDGTYNVWSRIKAPDTTNDSYFLQLDNACAVTVADSGVAAGAWTWVNHQDGNAEAKTAMTITAGSHTLKLTGRDTGVSVDVLLFLQDSCVPTDLGTNCTTAPADTTPPAVSVTSPADGSTVSGTVQVQVSASDNVGVTKVENYVDGSLNGASASPPYGFDWNTSVLSNLLHTIEAKAYDAAGNIGSHRISVTVNNTVTPPPPPPPSPSPDTTVPVVTILNPANGTTVTGTVNISARANDNVAVKSMAVYIDGTLHTQTNSDTLLASWNTKVKGKSAKLRVIEVRATDTAGNIGKAVSSVTVR